MAPLLESGVQVQVRRRRLYLPGDAVVVQAADGRLLAHRLLGGYPRAGRWRWLTQADSASWPDPATPTERLLGRIVSGQCSPLLVAVPFRARLKAIVRFGWFAVRYPAWRWLRVLRR